ncbi:MAG TPA: hypothetical protein PL196_09870, partial [Burkholderiaceae bacterium]|nr:hypothetical protein [Burkholderiaceae bacterium]
MTDANQDQAPAAGGWAAVSALFERAMDLPEAERAALLADPGLDPKIVAEVRSLLGHAAQHGEHFLAQPAQAASTPVPSLDGAQFGAWRIVGRLGAGGMGEVWLAERVDGAYAGRAAIKVLKAGMDSQAVLARFAREQHLLARLSHPNIA